VEDGGACFGCGGGSEALGVEHFHVGFGVGVGVFWGGVGGDLEGGEEAIGFYGGVIDAGGAGGFVPEGGVSCACDV